MPTIAAPLCAETISCGVAPRLDDAPAGPACGGLAGDGQAGDVQAGADGGQAA